MLAGRATAEGTDRFRRRFTGELDAGHFRPLGDLWLSSIGLGTYLGEADDATDEAYAEAVVEAVGLGCNVFDAAINYRHQRSERALAEGLERAIGQGLAARDELFVSTKGGFLPFDRELPADPAGWLRATWLDSGLLDEDDLARGCHALAPAFLADQLERSRHNLGLETVDLYHLHNPETQYADHPRPVVADRLAGAAARLDAERAAGRLARWGVATWDGLRLPPGEPHHLELAAFAPHRPSAVQLPLNLGRPEALLAPSQPLAGAVVPAVVAARKLGLAVFTSASLGQGRLARGLPERVHEQFPGLATDAQRAVQFARSAPGVTTALVGMSSAAHVAENLALALLPPAPPEAYQALFSGRPA